MFRDDVQLARALRVLLSSVPHMERFWTDEGPTDEAVDLCRRRGGPLSSGEAVMLLATFDLWNQEGELPFARLLQLDGDGLETLASLLVAASQGYDAIDTWTATMARTIEARRRESHQEKLARFRRRGGATASGAN